MNLQEFCEQNRGKVVEFHDVLFTDSGLERGMRARLKNYDVETHPAFRAIKIIFDMNGFMEYNRPFMTPDYYDENKNPRLYWDESQFWPREGRVDVWYDLDTPDDASRYLSVVLEEDIIEEHKMYIIRTRGKSWPYNPYTRKVEEPDGGFEHWVISKQDFRHIMARDFLYEEQYPTLERFLADWEVVEVKLSIPKVSNITENDLREKFGM